MEFLAECYLLSDRVSGLGHRILEGFIVFFLCFLFVSMKDFTKLIL